MESVGHNIQNLREDPHMISCIELISHSRYFINIGQYLFKQVQSQIRVGTQLVTYRPNNAVEYSIEEVFLQPKEIAKIELDQSLQKGEEIRSDLREAIEVTGNERQAGSKNHVDQFAQELAAQYHV